MQISNQYLKANFQSKGAELISLIKIDTGQEYIWQADPAHWARFTPILFPIVGRLKNDRYTHHGHTYAMSQHGFARDKQFAVVNQSASSITFSLLSSAETLENYPFVFELCITYTLTENVLNTKYEVKNAGNSEMYFSIGGHPAFKCAMTLAGTRSDYHLLFDKEETAPAHMLDEGVFSGKTKPSLEGGRLDIRDDLFDDDALVYKNLQSSKVTLISKDRKWLTFDFEGFPYLGIWSKSRRSPFVCIEPWYGLADHREHSGELSEKEGIQSLKSSEVFACEYAIQIH
ncbi:MAG: aldose 1-epimerase family protein [Cyclobacteriaceae bacterium]